MKKDLKILFGILFLTLCTSCNTYKKEIPTGLSHTVDNTYSDPTYNHEKLTNVLLLPIENPLESHLVDRYNMTLANSAIRNFSKFNYFNISYDSDSPLPAGKVLDLNKETMDRSLLGALGQEHHVQGVLQMSITDFNPYPSMRMHVKARLVDVETGQVVWTVDETFDTDDANVFNAMRIWWNSHKAGGNPFNRFDVTVLNPSFFMDYVFYSIAESYGKSRVVYVREIERAQNEKKS